MPRSLSRLLVSNILSNYHQSMLKSASAELLGILEV